MAAREVTGREGGRRYENDLESEKVYMQLLTKHYHDTTAVVVARFKATRGWELDGLQR